MEKVKLTKDLTVSKIGLGTLTLGKLQKNSSPKEIDKVISRCVERGVNFLDGAQLYESYHVIKDFLKKSPDAVVATKSYAYSKQQAEEAFFEALQKIDRDYIDIFLMHEQESLFTVKGHMEALDFYISMKEKGYIKKVGVSTHSVKFVGEILKEPKIDICHCLLNHKGFGYFDGTKEEMEENALNLIENGVGVYAMKIFGGGHLLNDRTDALSHLARMPHSAVIGMSRVEEVDFNIDFLEGNPLTPPTIEEKRVVIQDWCVGCMSCAQKCPQNAITKKDGKVTVNHEKCLLCGYCGAACKEMAIKIF